MLPPGDHHYSVAGRIVAGRFVPRTVHGEPRPAIDTGAGVEIFEPGQDVADICVDSIPLWEHARLCHFADTNVHVFADDPDGVVKPPEHFDVAIDPTFAVIDSELAAGRPHPRPDLLG